MDTELIEYFGFAHDPFAEGLPEQKFFNPKRKAVLAELHFWADQGQRFLVVTGPEGSGRSTLASAFIATCQSDDICLHLSVNGASDAGALQQQVANELGVADDLLLILDRLLLLNQQDKMLYLIVDNAEHLEQSALLFLLRLAQGSQGVGAQVIAFATEDIIEQLATASDNQALYKILQLEAWDQQESIEYLNFRLTMVGKSVDLFSSQEQRAIFDKADGWPRSLHEAAEDLLYLKAGSQPQRSAGLVIDVKKLLLIVAAVLVLLGVAISLWQYSSRTPAPEQQILEISRDGTASVSLDSAVTPDITWYMQQPASNYTLQILATRSENTAKNYVNTHGTNYRYFIKRQQNNKLYVVTYGSFKSLGDAQKQADDVKASSSDKPWARTFSSIQQEIE